MPCGNYRAEGSRERHSGGIVTAQHPLKWLFSIPFSVYIEFIHNCQQFRQFANVPNVQYGFNKEQRRLI